MDVTNQFKTVDMSLVGGISYKFENGLSIEAAYDHGLSRVDKNSNFKSYNRTFKVGLGFTF
jgi:opacity protein-like surface antigen